jgi:O-acetyl-ADP-ribose deacetylase (regulator of RNase III)
MNKNLIIENGDILDTDATYIVHQCNAVTPQASGLAKAIFDKFEYANIYSSRRISRTPRSGEYPGNIVICGNGHDLRWVVNAIAQYYPGKPKFPTGKVDGHEARKRYFKECLNKIAVEIIKPFKPKSIAFPYGIGCGLAGGNWNEYLQILDLFANWSKDTKIRIIKKG